MREALAPPDVEPAVVAILTVEDGPWVGTEYPVREPEEVNGVIRVSATGGVRAVDRVVVAPTVLIECWHDDEDVSFRIAQWAWARLQVSAGTIVNGVDIKFVDSTLPNNNPDVNRKRLVRYQFIAEIWTRLEPLTKERP